MTQRVFERRTRIVVLVFNLADSYAKARLGPRAHPRPYEPLRFWLVAREAPGPREVYASPRELVITRNASGYHLFFGEEWLSTKVARRLDDTAHRAEIRQPVTRRLDLAPGTYLVRVTSPLYQDEERPVVVPMPNLNLRDPGNPNPVLRDPLAQYTFELRPSHAYPFPDGYPLRVDDPDDCPDEPPPGRRGPTLLYGSLYATNGDGITGATVEIAGLTDICRTDKSGQWVLWLPDPSPDAPDPLSLGLPTVRVTLPDGTVIDAPDACVVRGCSTSLAQAALRGWVLRQGIGVAGATIAVSDRQETIATRADGGWTYCFGLNQPDESVSVTATLPDGTTQTQDGIEVRRRATVMVPTFTFL